MPSSNLIVDLTLFGLLFLSVVTWSISALKFRSFRMQNRSMQLFVVQYAKQRSWTERMQLARHNQSDVARLAQVGFATCLELSGEEGEGIETHELQEVLERQMRKSVQNMNRKRERGLAELASIGSTAPFIGLFGTVWGIMNALKTITATGNASIDVVAGPIGEALIATAIGIATAIPAVLMYNYFLRHQRVHVTEMDGFLDDFLRFAMRNRKEWSQSC